MASGQLALGGLRSLTLQNGTLRFTTMKCGTAAGAILLNQNAQNIALLNLSLIGANPTPGKSPGVNCESNHAVQAQGAQHLLLDHLTIRNFGGDCVYSGQYATVTWSHDLTFTNSSCIGSGRMGVGVADGLTTALIQNVTFDQLGWYATLDVEPNGVCVGTPCVAAHFEDIRFIGNQIGRGNSAKLTFVLSHASCCGSYPPVFGTITVKDNRTLYADNPWNASIASEWPNVVVQSGNQ